MMPDCKARRNVLIVDSEPATLLSLTYVLRRDGVAVTTATTVERAEKALNNYVYDLALIDVRGASVLDTGGLELLSFIKRKWPRTKVVVMSASEGEEVRNDAYRRGAELFFLKPFSIDQLTQLLQKTAADAM